MHDIAGIGSAPRHLVIGDRNTITADTLIERKIVPFRIVADMQMVPVSSVITSGVKAVDYHGYK